MTLTDIEEEFGWNMEGEGLGRRKSMLRLELNSALLAPNTTGLSIWDFKGIHSYLEMETLIPAPAPRQAKNIPEKQQLPPPPFLICSYICSAMLGASRVWEEKELGTKGRRQKGGLVEAEGVPENRAPGLEQLWKKEGSCNIFLSIHLYLDIQANPY